MKKTIGLLLFMFCCATNLDAQQTNPSRRVQFTDCKTSQAATLRKNDTLIVNCDSARVYNSEAMRILLGNYIKSDKLEGLLIERVQLSDSLRSVKDSIITAYKQMNALQNKFYADLRTIYTRTDSLARASTANTDAALNLVKKSQTASYITSSLAGGVAGGFIGGTLATGGAQVQFNLIGAIIGAAVGAGLNYLLLSLP